MLLITRSPKINKFWKGSYKVTSRLIRKIEKLHPYIYNSIYTSYANNHNNVPMMGLEPASAYCELWPAIDPRRVASCSGEWQQLALRSMTTSVVRQVASGVRDTNKLAHTPRVAKHAMFIEMIMVQVTRRPIERIITFTAYTRVKQIIILLMFPWWGFRRRPMTSELWPGINLRRVYMYMY